MNKGRKAFAKGMLGLALLVNMLGTAILSFGIHNIHQRTAITEGGIIGLDNYAQIVTQGVTLVPEGPVRERFVMLPCASYTCKPSCSMSLVASSVGD